jgi:purine-binding chemotaxis protein CheW
MATEQLTTFLVNGQHIGISVTVVQEVLQCQPMTRVPLAPPEVAGLLNLRGDVVTAVDVRRRLGMPERPEGMEPVNVVVRCGADRISLLVDSLSDVVDVDDDTFEESPEGLQGPLRDMVLGAYKQDEGLLIVLDAEQVSRFAISS